MVCSIASLKFRCLVYLYLRSCGANGRRPSKTECMNHLGLFEGIGGFSLAARWMGWKTVAWCEWNPFCQQVLKKNFPEAIGHGDITTTDFTPYANTVDVLTGGFPCQPFSRAASGKRKGTDDDRYLWPEMFRAIREIRPAFIVGENVAGLIELALENVLSDLETEGYTIETFVIPACAVGAAHRRDRIWVIAYDGKLQCNWRPNRDGRGQREQVEIIRNVWRRRGEKDGVWNVEPAICRSSDGLPEGLDKNISKRLQSLGNAIQPQVAYELFRVIDLTVRGLQIQIHDDAA